MNEDVLRSWAVDAQKMLDNLQAENEALKAKLKLINLKFTSSNSLPVDRITLTRAEFEGDK